MCPGCWDEGEALNFISRRISAAEAYSEASREIVHSLVAEVEEGQTGEFQGGSSAPPGGDFPEGTVQTHAAKAPPPFACGSVLGKILSCDMSSFVQV